MSLVHQAASGCMAHSAQSFDLLGSRSIWCKAKHPPGDRHNNLSTGQAFECKACFVLHLHCTTATWTHGHRELFDQISIAISPSLQHRPKSATDPGPKGEMREADEPNTSGYYLSQTLPKILVQSSAMDFWKKDETQANDQTKDLSNMRLQYCSHDEPHGSTTCVLISQRWRDMKRPKVNKPRLCITAPGMCCWIEDTYWEETHSQNNHLQCV